MPHIEIHTRIEADIYLCFDMARNIEIHQQTTTGTKERAIGGVTKGCINLGETVTWEAYHLGMRRRLTSKISAFNRPFHFRDEQIKGPFKSLIHDHYFVQEGNSTLMTDSFTFQSPAGIIGNIFNRLVLTRYMRQFLSKRNAALKQIAEASNGI